MLIFYLLCLIVPAVLGTLGAWLGHTWGRKLERETRDPMPLPFMLAWGWVASYWVAWIFLVIVFPYAGSTELPILHGYFSHSVFFFGTLAVLHRNYLQRTFKEFGLKFLMGRR